MMKLLSLSILALTNTDAIKVKVFDDESVSIK